MTKKAKTFYLCLFSVALSCILLLIFFMFGQTSPPIINDALTLSATDFSLYVEEIKTDFYTVSNKDAKIEFEYDDTIVYIDKNKIQGLKAGKTDVIIKASLYNLVEQTSITVTICEKSYHYEIIPTENCSYQDGVIISIDNACQFSLNIYDCFGNKIKDPLLQFSSDETFDIDYQFGQVYIYCEKDCIIYVETNFNYSFYIGYKKMSTD